ncbi:MAG: hypothetical protein UU54_C0003G0002 [Candidatus Yanofskybacteria bacterium GW2011_GWA2_41_22]|uniref:Sortase family protein n=4 Tax=Parcubacteria group TaxID=1794811 RepID=A0A0G0YMJ4_9BACT|nr:MAG: hypothetical protein UU54_C0003G0002 [Candidatus Yanofskybacteria bacterium GW2011_GWA2_41_22]KKS25739.1 MAG: hypothetical protein UU83_C0003G0032 [Candidatus Jorgensenbacteria bacterium GW2011_GWF2_41_8]KKS27582.1 MAG: hypothetical protein UU84_C0003G0027 [Candidatus Yanofskybacteria bacterium GW2011_GWC2_41_9]OGM99864.1 MAG: hypothetical protein A2736_02385 [Candidatus Yanofskybacteria bacterium RIFCSPHIGHO2_01_FULL_41_27]OGN08850.1 MAG: hypothetical protein A3C64_02385 [Candidatus Ya
MINFNFIKTEDRNQLAVSLPNRLVIETRRFHRLTANRFNLASVKDIKVAVILFVAIFLAVFSFMNRGEIFNSFNFNIFNNGKKEIAENERLTAELRAIYGYAARGGENAENNAGAYSQNNNNYYADNNFGNAAVESSDNISIPKINITAPIIRSASTDANIILNDLKRGVVLYPESALPGEGSAVIIGHSSSNFPWRKYSSVFSKLNKLEIGDSIFVNYKGRRLVFSVINKKIGTAKDLISSNIGGDLILGSCWPVGSDKERIMIAASLQNN